MHKDNTWRRRRK